MNEGASRRAKMTRWPSASTPEGRKRLGLLEVRIGMVVATLSACAGSVGLIEFVLAKRGSPIVDLGADISLLILIGSGIVLVGSVLLAFFGWRLVRRELR
jgi:hypothetical protein